MWAVDYGLSTELMSVSKLMHTYSLHTCLSHPNYYLCLHVCVLVFMMCNSLPTCTALTVDCYWTTGGEFIPHMWLCVNAWYCVDTVHISHPKHNSAQLVVSYNTCVQLVLWKPALTMTMILYMLCATAGKTGGEFI